MEDELILTLYRTDRDALIGKLPDRTRRSIWARASKLGVAGKRLIGRNAFVLRGEIAVLFLESRDGDGTIECLVSAVRLEEILSFGRWRSDRKRGGQTYARSGNTYLHRFLLRCPTGTDGDHINGDTLNNTDGNLRPVPRRGNCQNLGVKSTRAMSGYRGVGFHKSTGLWTASVRTNKKATVKYYATKEEAVRAVAIMRGDLHPYFARGSSAL